MRTILTLAPLIIAFILSSCGPGVSGGDGSVGRYAGEIISTRGLVFYARMDESHGNISDFFGRSVGELMGVVNYRVFGGFQNNMGPDRDNFAINFSGGSCFRFGDVDALSLQPPFSILFMVNPNVIGPYTAFGSWGSVGNHEWFMEITAGPAVQFNWSTDGSNTFPFVGSGIPTSTWTHIAMTVDVNGVANFYNEGVSSGSTSIPSIAHSPGTSFYIGCNDGNLGPGGESNFMNGQLDEIAIFNRHLEQKEIDRIYQARFN